MSGSIEFRPLEPHVEFTGTVDRLGHIEWKVTAQHPVGYGARLEFDFETDQALLLPLLLQLDEVIVALGLSPEMAEPTDTWLVQPDESN